LAQAFGSGQVKFERRLFGASPSSLLIPTFAKYPADSFKMHWRSLVLFSLFACGGARRSIRIDDSHHDLKSNARANGRRTSAEAREALIPSLIRAGVSRPVGGIREGVQHVGRRAGRPESRRVAPWSHFVRRAEVARASAPQMDMRSGIEPCPDGAKNCWSTADTGRRKVEPWRWPSSVSRNDAIATLKKVIESYPQEGNNGVDKGGWSFTVNELSPFSSFPNIFGGYAELEFKSGLGIWAKLFNGGEPFVDDVVLNVGDEFVSIFSSSRIGESDLGVNAKRINFIAAGLRAAGWDAPGVKG